MGEWVTAVETAADVLGEMLVGMAERGGDFQSEDLAAAALRAGLAELLDGAPDVERIDDVGRVLYVKLHDGGEERWGALTDIERGFWLDLAETVIDASDSTLRRRIGLPAAIAG